MYFGYNVSWDAYITIFFLIIAMVYLGYYGVSQSTMLIPSFLIHRQTISPTETNKQSYFKETEIDELQAKFHASMHDAKIYLSPDLNLKTIADTMDISERKLSAFFSEVQHQSFYDAINSYRVEEAKRLLESDAIKSHSIVGIGLSCGFSSKSSFYRIFKKTTNMSPLAYRESYIKESHRT
jgi:AraC-like DNA-binding protein